MSDRYNKRNTNGKKSVSKKIERNKSDSNLIRLKTDFESSNLIKTKYDKDAEIIINPLGYWTGSEEVDTGSVNRKLGSDMGRNVTGGGLHFKDISKADVSVNIYAFLKAQKWKKRIELDCAIGDTKIDGKPYSEIVKIAKEYIDSIGGFEKFAEWGLIRPTNIDDEIL